MGSNWVRSVTEPAAREVLLELARSEPRIVAASDSDAKGERALLYARAFAHPRDASIRFHEPSHSYFLNGKKLPISVTGFYNSFFSHFDVDLCLSENLQKWRASPKSKYHAFLAALRACDVSQQRDADIIATCWRLNGNNKSALGTALHRAIELTINEEPPTHVHAHDEEEPVDDTQRARLLLPFLRGLFDLPARLASWMLLYIDDPSVEEPRIEYEPSCKTLEFDQYRSWKAAHPELLPVRQEMNLWSEDHQLAGQLDALFWDSDAKHFLLADWKRVADMKEHPDRFTKYGKPPFQDVIDTSIGHYQIQQNLYAFILKTLYNVEVKRMLLVQLHERMETYREYEVPFMEEQVREALDDRRKKLSFSPSFSPAAKA